MQHTWTTVCSAHIGCTMLNLFRVTFLERASPPQERPQLLTPRVAVSGSRCQLTSMSPIYLQHASALLCSKCMVAWSGPDQTPHRPFWQDQSNCSGLSSRNGTKLVCICCIDADDCLEDTVTRSREERASSAREEDGIYMEKVPDKASMTQCLVICGTDCLERVLHAFWHTHLTSAEPGLRKHSIVQQHSHSHNAGGRGSMYAGCAMGIARCLNRHCPLWQLQPVLYLVELGDNSVGANHESRTRGLLQRSAAPCCPRQHRGCPSEWITGNEGEDSCVQASSELLLHPRSPSYAFCGQEFWSRLLTAEYVASSFGPGTHALVRTTFWHYS